MKPARCEPASLPMGEADCFFLAIEQSMKQAGQGMLLGQTVVELAAQPDISRLRKAMARLVKLHPVCTWVPRYSSIPLRPPVLVPSPKAAEKIPFHEWAEGQDVESVDHFCRKWGNASAEEFDAQGVTNVRCDLIKTRERNYCFVLTWRHNVFDASGADLLLREIAALAEGGEPYIEKSTTAQDRAAQSGSSLRDHISLSAPMRKYINCLMNQYRFGSFCGTRPGGGRNRFFRETLDKVGSESVDALSERYCGLFPSLYYLACATKAHHRLWEIRGGGPEAYFLSLPVSLRKPGSKGPLFQNNISFLFLYAESAIANDVQQLCANFHRQQVRFLKAKLDVSFLHLQHLMRHLPPSLYAKFLRWRMQGNNSLFHSCTGELADGLATLAGAPIVNAWHAPVVFSPPGTGLFLSRKFGRLTTITSWREGIISSEEAEILTKEFLTALQEG